MSAMLQSHPLSGTPALIVTAENRPRPGIAAPGPHQTWHSPALKLAQRPQAVLAPGHIRVEMILAGICGTDLHLVTPHAVTGYTQCSAPLSIPSEGRVIGHEGVGRIRAVGEGVAGLQPGDVVAFESILSCGICGPCRGGHPNQCRESRLLGLEFDGLFSEIADVPARLARPVPEAMQDASGLAAAACLEPAGVAWLACINSAVAAADRVTVFGGGPIGLLSAMLCRHVFGAARVELVEPVDFRRQHAAAWCDAVWRPEDYAAEGHRCDVLIDASGAMAAVAAAIRRIDANGRVCLLARNGEPLVLDAVDHMITNNIRLTGSRGHLGGLFEKITSLYLAGRLPFDAIVTARVNGLSELARMLADPDTLIGSNCKVLCRIAGA